MRKRIKKVLLLIIGLLSVVLGVIGAVLPLLPTTPFLILALACFAKSSPRFHQKLLNNRWFGADLQQWEESKTISHKSKRKAMILILITFTVSIVILNGRPELQIGLLVLGSLVLMIMWRLKEMNTAAVLDKENK